MPGANLVFHIGSALLIGTLVYLMLRFKKQRDFLRRSIKANAASSPIAVDTPLQFLRKYCDALNLSFDATTIDWPKPWEELQKIRYADLLSLQRMLVLQEIKPQKNGHDQVQLNLVCQPPVMVSNETPNSLDFGFTRVPVIYS